MDLLIIGIAAMSKNETPTELANVLAQMMDATAKTSPGMLRGSRNLYGFKQECDIVKYKVPNQKREFTTSYSRVYISLTEDCENLEATLGFDICMPSSCTSMDLESLIAIIPEINATFANITNMVCAISTFADINKPMTLGSWIMM
uniref:Nose resistant-to-fluoxetine protein N-terminal domain-containing protein n=1 Tax=Panagrolaimus davidi TaxID=227884 RepID=A0A914PQB1_9BILA